MVSTILRSLYALGIMIGTYACIHIDTGRIMIGFTLMIVSAILIGIGSYGWE